MVLLLALALLVFLSYQSPSLTGSHSFVRSFWLEDRPYPPRVLLLPDGDIILAHLGSFSSDTDMVVYRLTSRGEVKWAKRLGTDEPNDLTSIALGADGNVAILGKAYYNSLNYGLHLTILTVEGDVLLSKVYYYSRIYTSWSRITSDPTDGGYVIAGQGKIPRNRMLKTFAFKVSSSGEIEWSVNVNDNISADKFLQIMEPLVMSAGDVILLGFLDKPQNIRDDTFLVKLNGSG